MTLDDDDNYDHDDLVKSKNLHKNLSIESHFLLLR